MVMSINTNLASMNAQRNLGKVQNMLNNSLQRLSSGLRVNSAKDDAAGLAISNRMGAQVRGLNQAVRNSNDGISLAQTAEGAMQEVTANLQRIRELAVQSANDTNSTADRSSLNAEATQLIAEIERVATTTSFNGKVLLDGSFGSASFQVGANQGQQIAFGMISVRSSALGVGSGSSYSASINGAVMTDGAALAAGDIQINGYQVGATSSDGVSTASASGSAIAKAAAINAISGDTGVTAKVNATTVSATATSAASSSTGIVINGVAIDDTAAATSGGSAKLRAAEIVAAINEKSNLTGVVATLTAGTTGGYTLTAADGRNINIAVNSAGASGLSAGTTLADIDLSSTSSSGIVLSGAGATAAIIGSAATTADAAASAGAGVSSLDLSTASGAGNAITIVDAALATIDSARGNLGAVQNRFESTIANLQNVAENLSAAKSRIVDADFAAETAGMTKAQVMQQAGVAMLAQANQLPQTVLSLLK